MQDEEKILEQLKELDKAQDKNPVTLASLKTLKSAIYNRDVDLQTVVKLRTLNETTLKSENIKIYFCSLCGKKAIGANIGLDTLPTRRSDNSIAINLKQIFIRLFLKQEGIKYIKRSNSVEKQYRWCCEECGVHVAYQCVSYEEGAQLIQGNSDIQLSNKPYLYVLNDAIVLNQQFSKVHSEIAKLKDQMEYEQLK
ncbi:unnamed protein product [Paramecium primaurelia]|uniref:STEEP1 domain-containing protein n=2 Tax=Paramecium TaxID=5884 RepID=A0A8S1UAJ8_9CILI|nr:unnamed protein product [Paramecium primaurelia]CAD8161314.1 unnamed protein product [Paramecium pentaurelia]